MSNPPTTFIDSEFTMPALFVGHGSPMNAIEENEFSRAWMTVGASLPKPRAILCISAHWETGGPCVTAMSQPKTIDDFYGFPEALSQKQYPAPGSPELAYLIQETLPLGVKLDYEWGLDHGTWSVLCRMFPKAEIPVVQLSLDRTQKPEFHYELGQQLQRLRTKGVLIIGSGNVVHNLREVMWRDTAYDWAIEFDHQVKISILARDHAALIHYEQLGQSAQLSIPTNEHYLPLLYVLALQRATEAVSFFAEKVTLGAISMRSVKIG